MGKGDRKSRRGKIAIGSYGVRRRRKKADKPDISSANLIKKVESKDKKPAKGIKETRTPEEAKVVDETKTTEEVKVVEEKTAVKAAPKAPLAAKKKVVKAKKSPKEPAPKKEES